MKHNLIGGNEYCYWIVNTREVLIFYTTVKMFKLNWFLFSVME